MYAEWGIHPPSLREQQYEKLQYRGTRNSLNFLSLVGGWELDLFKLGGEMGGATLGT